MLPSVAALAAAFAVRSPSGVIVPRQISANSSSTDATNATSTAASPDATQTGMLPPCLSACDVPLT